jgi:hypothetical protein
MSLLLLSFVALLAVLPFLVFDAVTFTSVRAQSVSAVLAALRNANCGSPDCLNANLCARGGVGAGITTSFGLLKCSDDGTRVVVIELDGSKSSLSGSLVFPSGGDITQVRVKNQAVLSSVDFRELSNPNLQIELVGNLALATALLAGACARLVDNPMLATIMFGAAAMSRLAELTISGSENLGTVNLQSLTALRKLTVSHTTRLRNVTGLRGRTDFVTLVVTNNSRLEAIDDLEVSMATSNATVQVVDNPRLGGVCRLAATSRPALCELELKCLQNKDRCRTDCSVAAGRSRACESVSPDVACPLPTHTCPPNSIGFTSFGTSVASGGDLRTCMTLSDACVIPAVGNVSFADCAVNVTEVSFAFQPMGCTTCTAAMRRGPAGNIDFFSYGPSGPGFDLMRLHVVPNGTLTSCFPHWTRFMFPVMPHATSGIRFYPLTTIPTTTTTRATPVRTPGFGTPMPLAVVVDTTATMTMTRPQSIAPTTVVVTEADTLLSGADDIVDAPPPVSDLPLIIGASVGGGVVLLLLLGACFFIGRRAGAKRAVAVTPPPANEYAIVPAQVADYGVGTIGNVPIGNADEYDSARLDPAFA